MMRRGRAPQAAAPFGIYVHVPFCLSKCPYCDFNTYAGMEHRFDETVSALTAEMALRAPEASGRTAESVFIGGGTPSILSAHQLTAIFDALRSSFHIDSEAEITCEVNPGAADRAKFEALRALGVNRLSIGVQSFDDRELQGLGRAHGAADAEAAFRAARAAGFREVSLDLMFGTPGQSRESWIATLDHALELSPEHLSMYSLIVESDTPLAAGVSSGRVSVPDDDAAAVLYEIAQERAAAAGYVHYEVSNWARSAEPDSLTPIHACHHNLIYWRNQEWLGIGPGAHGHLRRATQSGQPGEIRYGNVRPIDAYVKSVARASGIEELIEEPTPATAMGETMLLGLRLVREGVPLARFAGHHGADLREVYSEVIDELCDAGLLMLDDQRVRLTSRGLMLGNRVAERFLG